MKEENEKEGKNYLDKMQDLFYKHLSTFEYFVVFSFATTVIQVFSLLFIIKIFGYFSVYLGLLFMASFILMAVSSVIYFLCYLYFSKRRFEKSLKSAESFRQKFLKYFYNTVKYLLGLSFILNFIFTFVGDFVISQILGKHVHVASDGYSLIAVKFLIFAGILLSAYTFLMLVGQTAQMFGLGDRLEESESIFDLRSKKSFALVIGGALVFFGLLGTSALIDNKIAVVIDKVADKTIQMKKEFSTRRNLQ